MPFTLRTRLQSSSTGIRNSNILNANMTRRIMNYPHTFDFSDFLAVWSMWNTASFITYLRLICVSGVR